MKPDKLKRELHQVGVSPYESEGLSELAKSIKESRPEGLSKEAKKRIAPHNLPLFAAVSFRTLAMSGSFVVFLVVIMMAQSSKPSSLLYNVKRSTEEARGVIQPSYKENIAEERKKEYEQLKNEAAPIKELNEADKRYKESLEKAKRYREKSRSNSSYEEVDRKDERIRSKRSRDQENKYRERGDFRR